MSKRQTKTTKKSKTKQAKAGRPSTVHDAEKTHWRKLKDEVDRIAGDHYPSVEPMFRSGSANRSSFRMVMACMIPEA